MTLLSIQLGRIRGARYLLTTAAVIMSVFLITSSVVTTLLIPPAEFQPGGSANGRALAYLAHEYLGSTFGSIYDASTIAILWFAGASAMAGLLNLIPRFLPRYGMAPHWARAVRPLVLILMLGAFLITIIFRANVDAQGGAYATGVLVVITSAAVAVTLAARHDRQHKLTIAFSVVALIFIYTTIANIIERPEGVKIAAIFIAAILAVSLASRFARSFELRVTDVTFDPTAQLFIRDTARRTIRFIAKEPDRRKRADYSDKLRQVSRDNDLTDPNDVIFVEVTVTDPSEFAGQLDVKGEVQHDRYRVIAFSSSSVRMHWPPYSCPYATTRTVCHTSTSNGQRAIPQPTCSASCSSVLAKWRPLRGRSSGAPNLIEIAVRTYTPADSVADVTHPPTSLIRRLSRFSAQGHEERPIRPFRMPFVALCGETRQASECALSPSKGALIKGLDKLSPHGPIKLRIRGSTPG
jgi:hypothetical protein